MAELNESKKKALELARIAIEKQYGKGAIMTNQSLPDIEFLSTGITSIDAALGGGFGKGRIHEIYGPESSGKSTLTLHVVAEVQKDNGTAAFIDAEHAFDRKYATALGV